MLQHLMDRIIPKGKSAKVVKPIGSPPPGTRLYVIGDIHGHLDHLRDLHRMIDDDAYRARAKRNVVVYVGDYVDRGPESRGVIDLLLDQPLQGFEAVHLMGNHEAVMLDFIASPGVGDEWLTYGGDTTLESYGVAVTLENRLDPGWIPVAQQELADAIPTAHRHFLENLRLYHIEGDFLMVHAGINPGVSIEAQSIEDLLWIREPFLSSSQPFGKVVIHGHTIRPEPEVKPNRIGIDTGAYRLGVLTCAVLQDGHYRFIQSTRR